MTRMPEWFKHATAYEIYPQSFSDTNGDGIGDLRGVIEKLDYVKSLGCDTIWLNPCYDSPMQDAGYDVRDYKKIAARYGTNDDAAELFRLAHEKGMHILLDLVPGHTSIEHEWFRRSQEPARNAYSDRFVWSQSIWDKPAGFNWICGRTDRDGCALINFFDIQPALNYGFGESAAPWQMRYDDPRALATFDAILDVMRFWLSMGCDGFRVDMADSLVKCDPGKEHTAALWRKAQDMLAAEFPEAVMVSEWSIPEQALTKGRFQGDFYLDHEWGEKGRGYHHLMRNGQQSWLRKDSTGDLAPFLTEYLERYEATKGDGYICLITGNHDTPRAAKNLDPSELKMAYSLLFTLPGVPFLYMGDEIGTRYLPLDSKEGGYGRTGSRTPMQWNGGKNHGFSTSDAPYLPTDSAPDAPTVEAQAKDPDSLLRYVKSLLALRRSEPDLQADAPFELLCDGDEGRALVYRRGALTLALNPRSSTAEAPILPAGTVIFEQGTHRVETSRTLLSSQTFLILKS